MVPQITIPNLFLGPQERAKQILCGRMEYLVCVIEDRHGVAIMIPFGSHRCSASSGKPAAIAYGLLPVLSACLSPFSSVAGCTETKRNSRMEDVLNDVMNIARRRCHGG